MVVDDIGRCCLHFQIWKEEHFSMKIYNKIEENMDNGLLGGDFRVGGRGPKWEIWLFLIKK